MRRPTATPERVLRAAVFALVAVTVGVVAHRLGSGMSPRPVIVFGSIGVLAPLGWWVGARSRGRVVLVPLTLATQLGLHAMFALSMGPNRASMLLCQPSHLTGWHSTHLMPAAASPLSQNMHMSGGHPAHGEWMLLAHLGAAVLVGLWLREGEQVLDLILTALPALIGWRRLAVLFRALPDARGPVRQRRARPAVRFRQGRVVKACGLRGPPRALPH